MEKYMNLKKVFVLWRVKHPSESNPCRNWLRGKNTLKRIIVLELFKLAWVLCLMAYQPSWVIQCRVNSCRRTTVVQFNPLLEWKIRGFIPFPKVKAKVHLEFVRAYYDVTVQLDSHCATGTSYIEIRYGYLILDKCTKIWGLL